MLYFNTNVGATLQRACRRRGEARLGEIEPMLRATIGLNYVLGR